MVWAEDEYDELGSGFERASEVVGKFSDVGNDLVLFLRDCGSAYADSDCDSGVIGRGSYVFVKNEGFTFEPIDAGPIVGRVSSCSIASLRRAAPVNEDALTAFRMREESA